MYEGVRQVFVPLVQKKIREVVGEEHLPSKPPFILSPNHIGFFDAPFLTVFVLKKYNLPLYAPTVMHIVRAWGGQSIARRWMGMLPVRPENPASVLDEANDLLRQNNIVAIFPEGSRNDDPNQLDKGKTGAVRLALMSGAPLIPVGLISNTGYKIWTGLYSLFRHDRYVKMVFGQPLDLSEYRGQPIDKPLLESAHRKLMLAISALCGKVYNY
ncbi:MAG: lysophospholipid acyltransferase family protein [Patescibacteria group bacterium]|jgi:1-acyl-sn-glycerol-3-phosphate acyltransferase